MADIDEKIAPDSEPLTTPEAAPQEAAPAAAPAPETPAPPVSRLRSKAQELGFDGDDHEDFLGSYISDLEGYKTKSEEVNSALYDSLQSDPAFMEVARLVAVDGLPFLAAIHQVFSPEELQALPDDPYYNDVETAKKTRAQRMTEKQQREAQMAQNGELSMQAITEFASENNLSEQEAADFLGKVDEALSEIYEGKVSKQFLSSMFRALNFDKAVGQAKELGEIAGRNANIETTKINKPLGDGLPHMQSGGETASAAPPRAKSRMEELRDEEKRRRII